MSIDTSPDPDLLGTMEHHRGRLAYSTRIRGADAAETQAARRDFRAARLAAYIRREVDQAPPLTGEQRDRLACLLRPRASSSQVKAELATLSEAAST